MQAIENGENEGGAIQAEYEKLNEREIERGINVIALKTRCRPDLVAWMRNDLLHNQFDRTPAWVKVALRFLDLNHDNSNWQLEQLLVKLPNTVEAIYDRFLCSIPREKRELVCRMLLIVIGSRRPLRFEETEMLVCIRYTHKSVEQLKRACRCQPINERVLEKLLGPFVKIHDNMVELIDPTVRQYLMDLAHDTTNELCMFFGISETEPDEVLAEACMSYLLVDSIRDVDYGMMKNMSSRRLPLSEIDKGDPDDYDDAFGMSGGIEIRDEGNKAAPGFRCGLFDYASKYWALHLSKFRNMTAVSLHPLAKGLSDPEGRILHSWLSHYWTKAHPKEPYPCCIGPVFVAAFFGHASSLSLYLREGNMDGGELETALYWASRNGYAVVVSLLLHKGIKPDTAVNGKFPQHVAAEFGHCSILKLFVADETVDMNVTYQGRTPISLAAGAGRTAAVVLLLSAHQVRPDLPDDNGMAALCWASANGFASCVIVLLASLRVKAGHTDKSGRTALSHAVLRGHVDIVKLFLKALGAANDIPVNFGHTCLPCITSARPLSRASSSWVALTLMLID